jgi:hypothetical protein
LRKPSFGPSKWPWKLKTAKNSIYIDKLKECLEKEGRVGPNFTGIFINLLHYADDIVLMERSPHDLENQLRILKDFFSNMGMTVNTDKTKVMIIKSNKIPYDTFVYEKTTWRK